VTGVPAGDIVAAAYLYASGGTSSGPEKLPEPTHPGNIPVSRNGREKAETAEQAEEAVLESVAREKVTRPEGGFPPSTIVFPASGPYTLTTATVQALVNLALVTGNVGRAGGGVNPLVADTNCMGANDMGCTPDYFPGYRPVNADNAREMESIWTVNPDRAAPELSGDPGVGLPEMIEAAESGDMKAMWVVGANPVLSADQPDSDRVRRALQKLDFLVVQDILMNETGELADVILPAASFAEKDGTVTNTERRIQRFRQAIEPVGVSKPDLWIIAEIGKRLGVEIPSKEPRDVLEEITRVVPLYRGVSFARLDMTEFIEDAIPMPAAVSFKQLKVKSLMWPCPEPLHAGTPVLYADRFATPDGKAHMAAATVPAQYGPDAAPSEPPAEDALMATIGFPLFPFRTGTLSRHSYGLSRVEPDPRLHINPADAARLGIGNQTPVQVLVEGVVDSAPVYAISLVYDRIPEGRAFLAMTLEQSGTNKAVREARYLKSANIGVAMGITGTDVSKEAADMVLTDDNFASIVKAIEEGRGIFDNIRKYLIYLLSSNAGELLTMFAGVMFASVLGLASAEAGLFLPLLAAQLLWINLITDGPPALALGIDPKEPGVMSREPRRRGAGVLTTADWLRLGGIGLVMMVGTLAVLDAYYPGGLFSPLATGDAPNAADETYSRTMAFTTLMMFQLFNVFNCRSTRRSAFSGFFDNKWLIGAVALSLLTHVLVIYVPVLQTAFHTVPLSVVDWGVATGVAAILLLLMELSKLGLRRAPREEEGGRRLPA
jgi:hypothetical protein